MNLIQDLIPQSLHQLNWNVRLMDSQTNSQNLSHTPTSLTFSKPKKNFSLTVDSTPDIRTLPTQSWMEFFALVSVFFVLTEYCHLRPVTVDR